MDRSVWVSYFSTLCHSIGVDPVFAFTALVMGPLLLLVWWVSTKKEKQLDSKMYEIRLSELPESMEFFTRPSSPLMLAVCGVISASLLWHYNVGGFQEKVYLPLGYAIFIGLVFAAQHGQNSFSYNKPLVTLSKAGFKYGSRFYDWDAIGTIEVLHYSKSSDQFSVKLKQGTQLSKIVCYISLSSIKQPWLPQYAQEYWLRFGSGKNQD